MADGDAAVERSECRGGGEAFFDEVGGGAGDVAEGGDQVVAVCIGAELASDGGEGAEVVEGLLCRGIGEEGQEPVGRDGAGGFGKRARRVDECEDRGGVLRRECCVPPRRIFELRAGRGSRSERFAGGRAAPVGSVARGRGFGLQNCLFHSGSMGE